MKLPTLATFGLALALAVSACSTGPPTTPSSTQPTSALPTAPQGTATSVPPTATLVPTVVPTPVPTTAPTPTPVVVPTTAPTSTSDARAAPNGSAATASDLKPIADAMAAAKSYRLTITLIGAAPAQNGTVVVDVVRPDRLDTKANLGGRTFETISIGSDTYVKNGATWVKSTVPNPVPALTGLLSNDPQKLVSQMASNQKNGTLSKDGADQVDGTPCQDWIWTPSVTNTTSRAGTMCIGQNNLIVQFKSNDGRLVVKYSNWNAPISITAPV